MKVLLSNHSLAGVGGTEKWTYAMARELQRRGYEVAVFTFACGLTAHKLAERGIRVFDKDVPVEDFDLKLINSSTCLEQLRSVKGFTVFTSHGPKHPLEMPSSGADAYAAVSPEVQDRVAGLGHRAEVIYNGVDLSEFTAEFTPDAYSPPRVLSLCKSVATSWMLSDACNELKWPFTWVNYRERVVWDIAGLIHEHDIVVGCGRSAIEGLACGRAVLVFDGRTEEPRADGWVTRDNVEHLRRKNFSCRTQNEFWNVQALTEKLLQASPQPWSRSWAEHHADVRHTASQYLHLYDKGSLTHEQSAAAAG